MKKTVRRVLASVLAVLMVAVGLPLGALAETAPSPINPADTSQRYAEMTLGIGIPNKVPEVVRSGRDVTIPDPNKLVDFDKTTYGNLLTVNKGDNYFYDYPADEAGAREVVKTSNNLFPMGTEVTAEAGDTIWLGVKLRGRSMGANQYVVGGNTFIAYDADAFDASGASAGAVLNHAITGSIDGVSDTLNAATTKDYYSEFTDADLSVSAITLSADSSYHKAGRGLLSYTFLKTSGSTWALPEEATWDVLIPLTVKSTAAPGTYYIDVEPSLINAGGNKSTAIQVATGTNGSLGAPSEMYNATDTPNHFKSNVVAVKVTGPSIELKGIPKVLNTTGQKVTVTPGGGLTPASDAEWLICESGQTTGVTATAAAKGDDYELTFDASTLKTDGATEYVVVYKKDPTTLKTEGKFKVTAALTGTAKITGTAKVGETLTAALDGGPVGATLKYQWTAGGKSISGATSSTYTLTAAEAGKTISVVISATGYEGTKTAPATAAVADGDAPSISGVTIDTAEYGADITAAIKAKFTSDASSTFTFSAVNNSILKVDSNKVTVGKGAISGGNNTVNVSIKRPGYAAASTTATLTAKTKKAVTLAQTSGSAGNNAEFTLPGLNGVISGDTAPTITWTKGAETACTATLNGNKITAVLTNVANPGTVALTAAITSDDYQLSSGAYTLNVTAAAMTNITLNTEATNAGFSVSPAAIVQGQSGKVTVTIPADTKIDSITVDGNAVTLDANNQFELSTTQGQSTAAVVITFHAAKTVTATITAKPYDGTTAIDKSDVSFNVAGVTFEKAEYESADADTGIKVTITGITWPDTTNEYTLAPVTGDITTVTPASAAAAATAVANTNPTTANVIEAIKAAVITFTNADGKTFTMTVGDLLADATTDTVLEAAINDAIDGVEAFESTAAPVDNVKYDASQATVSATVNPGSVIAAENAGTDKTFTLVDVYNDEATPEKIETGFTVDAATGAITVGTEVEPDIYTLNITTAAKTLSGMKEEAAAAITATITVEECAKEYKLENLAENATGEINLGNIVSMLDAAKSPNIAALPATIELSLNVTKSTTPPPGPSGSFKPYMDGYEDGTLLPGRSVTRAQFAKMLVIATGKFDETKTYEKPDYPDVIEGKWYVPYIACAVENKIMDGKEDGKMYPNKTITRQEAAKMIYVALGTTDEIKTTDKVKDFDSVQNWAKMYVATLVEKNIIKGFDDGTFKPKNNITRAQAAVMINRLLGFDPDEAERAKIAELTIEDQFPDVKPSGNWSYAHLMYAAGKLPDSYYAG